MNHCHRISHNITIVFDVCNAIIVGYYNVIKYCGFDNILNVFLLKIAFLGEGIK